MQGSKNRVHVVIIYRDPHEVADSLFAKKKIPKEHSIALWELYNRSLLEHSADLPRHAFAFWDMMGHARDTLHQLADAIGRPQAAALVTDAQLA